MAVAITVEGVRQWEQRRGERERERERERDKTSMDKRSMMVTTCERWRQRARVAQPWLIGFVVRE